MNSGCSDGIFLSFTTLKLLDAPSVKWVKVYQRLGVHSESHKEQNGALKKAAMGFLYNTQDKQLI